MFSQLSTHPREHCGCHRIVSSQDNSYSDHFSAVNP